MFSFRNWLIRRTPINITVSVLENALLTEDNEVLLTEDGYYILY